MAYGDPHVRSFSGYECDLMGVGVFWLVSSPQLEVQTFHCPLQRAGSPLPASSISAIAVRALSNESQADTLVIIDTIVLGESPHCHHDPNPEPVLDPAVHHHC